MPTTEPSIFTRIIAREIPASIVAENDRMIAFHDIAPKAPVHILVVPKTPEYANVAELAAGDPGLLAELVSLAQQIADDHGGQFRLIFNTGEKAGQTVFHVHAHILIGDLREDPRADLQ
jgi:histidine triad (HIT) family protein